MDDGVNATVTLGGNRTLANPTNITSWFDLRKTRTAPEAEPEFWIVRGRLLAEPRQHSLPMPQP